MHTSFPLYYPSSLFDLAVSKVSPGFFEFLPTDLNKNAEKINMLETIIDEKICRIEIWKIIPKITTIINTRTKIGSHFFRNCIIFIFDIIRNTIKTRILKQFKKNKSFNQTKISIFKQFYNLVMDIYKRLRNIFSQLIQLYPWSTSIF
jgi:hypothetical protein